MGGSSPTATADGDGVGGVERGRGSCPAMREPSINFVEFWFGNGLVDHWPLVGVRAVKPQTGNPKPRTPGP